MNKEVNFEALWKACTKHLTKQQIKLLGECAIKSIKRTKKYEYRATMEYARGRLESTDVDSVGGMNWFDTFEWVYFYRNAKKPNLIVTLIKKYLYC